MSAAGSTESTRVNADNFERAETDTYFTSFADGGEFGRLVHRRELADVAHQTVVRPNRDTLYSTGLFDLDAGAVRITLPDAGGRFMSLLLVNEDHYNPVPTTYAPGTVIDQAFLLANNPGLTLFHCHQQLHMDFGFMALFDYTT